MTDRPILFSAPMIRAILREIRTPGTGKTQTRRVLKITDKFDDYRPTSRLVDYYGNGRLGMAFEKQGRSDLILPVSFAPGDRLWVREAFTKTQHSHPVYRADACDLSGKRWSSIEPGDPAGEVLWKPSIHMPRWASRITLEVTDVRVQRLQEISGMDPIEEGVEQLSRSNWHHDRRWRDYSGQSEFLLDHRDSFRTLWDSLNADRGFGWRDNPWVVAVTFRPHLCNIDQMEKAA